MFDPEDEQSLTEVSGLNMSLAADETLKLSDSIIVGETHAFTLEQMRAVALDSSSCYPAEKIHYWHYDQVMRRRDRERVLSTNLRYGLTQLSSKALGQENAKTFGQIFSHPLSGTLSYPAVCEVLTGSAWFLFQQIDEERLSAPFCAVLQANPRDKIVIPPNLHHVVISIGSEPLLFATVTSSAAKSSFRMMTKLHGGAWLHRSDQGWIKNPTYHNVADLIWWSPQSHPEMGITPNRPLYQNLVQLPESLLWLLEPMSFPDIFPDIWDGLANQMNIT